jgi:arylsulfatase A-like enzyme
LQRLKVLRETFLYLPGPQSSSHSTFRSENLKVFQKAGIYGDVIEEIDWSVGQILRTLKEEGIADNTMVILLRTMVPGLFLKHMVVQRVF